jgi:tripartite-type tricarboxylate transporter receptor subunit TctC
MFTQSHLGRALCCAIFATTMSCGQSFAQDFPTKTVRITTPFPVGSGPEGVLRVLAESLSKRWGKPVIVENKPGANGFIAIDQTKRQAADGHELLQMDTSQMTTYQSLFRKLPYEVMRDFDPIIPLFRNYFMVTVSKDSPIQSMREIIASAKSAPGKITYGSWSIGNPVHIASAMVETDTGTTMTHVPYKETSQLHIGVANREVDWAFGSVATAGSLERAGKLKYIAVSAAKRLPDLPNVPTVAESGGPANFDYSAWTAIVAPKGVPAATLDKIHRDIAASLAEPALRERFAALSYENYSLSRSAFIELLNAESKRNGAIVKRLNVQLD